MYCTDCDDLISAADVSSHKKHDIVTLSEAHSIFKVKLDEATGNIDLMQSTLESDLDRSKEKKVLLESMFEEIEMELARKKEDVLMEHNSEVKEAQAGIDNMLPAMSAYRELQGREDMISFILECQNILRGSPLKDEFNEVHEMFDRINSMTLSNQPILTEIRTLEDDGVLGNKREEQNWTESESNYGHQNRQAQECEPRSYNNCPSYREPGGASIESNFGHCYRQDQEHESRSYNDRTQYRDSRGINDYNQHYRTNSKERHYDNRGSHYRNTVEDDVSFSKSLSYLLRHGAAKQKFELLKGGFLYVNDILSRQQFRGFTLEDVQRIVASKDMKRFHIEFDEDVNKWKIRANHGHTMKVEDLALTPIFDAKDYPTVVHGTYLKSWNIIRKTGLKTMGRNHIQFAPGAPGESGVISGMLKSCDVLIFLNLEKSLEAGIKFFISANNVILSSGNDHGIIPAEYFQTVVNRQTGALLSRDDDAKSMTHAAIQMTQQVDTKREQMMDKKKKKKKKKKELTQTDH